MIQQWTKFRKSYGVNKSLVTMNVFTKSLLVCVVFCICACGSTPQVSEEEFTPRYGEFYSFAKGRETWLIDTIFLGVSSVNLRYEHGAGFYFSQPICKGRKRTPLPIIIRDEKLYIGNIPLDTFLLRAKIRGCDINYDFSNAIKIIKLLEDYRIGDISVNHESKSIEVDFFERGDSIIKMHYSATEEVHRINSDSSCVMKGWSIYKEKKKSDEQLYN